MQAILDVNMAMYLVVGLVLVGDRVITSFKRQIIGVVFAASAFVGGYIHLAETRTIWIALLLASGALVLVAMVYMVVAFLYEVAYPIKHLAKAARMVDRRQYSVRLVKDESELQRVSVVDQLAYGEHSVSYEFLHALWKAYPRGLWGIWRGDEVIGAVEIWPLEKREFIDMSAGRRTEGSLNGASIDQSVKKQYWYVAGIFLVKGKRCSDAIRTLVSRCLTDWLASPDLAPSIDICAIAASERGANMLRRFGFQMAVGEQDSVHGARVFVRKTVNVKRLRRKWRMLCHSPALRRRPVETDRPEPETQSPLVTEGSASA